jgi:hypothetical protein
MPNRSWQYWVTLVTPNKFTYFAIGYLTLPRLDRKHQTDFTFTNMCYETNATKTCDNLLVV